MKFYDDSHFSDSSEPSFDSTPSPDTAERKSERERQLKAIRSFVRGCLKESTDPHHILAFTRKLLWQKKLYGFLDEKEILNDVYCRAVKAVNSGKKLSNLPGWFKQTISNCISEVSKKEAGLKKCARKLQKTDRVCDIFEDILDIEHSMIENNVTQLMSAFKNLNEEEQLILILWKVKGYSWKEIGAYYVKQGKLSCNDRKSQACLRQRGQRALSKLRKLF